MQAYQGQYLHAYLSDKVTSIEHVIQSATDEQLANETSYVASLIDKYTIQPLHLHLDRATMTPQKNTIMARELPLNMRFGSGINPYDPRPLQQNSIMYYIPFSGDGTLLQYDPMSSCRLSLPKLTIEKGEIKFEVVINEHIPSETGDLIKTYSNWIQRQIDYINTDLAPYNSALKERIQHFIDKENQSRNKLSAVFTNIGIPFRQSDKINLTQQPSNPIIPISSSTYYPTALSYGGLDVGIATKLHDYLTSHGVPMWFYPENNVPGEKLHRMMSEMVTNAERVILLCSKSSLHRIGVLNEIERVLEKEAKEAGSSILIPLALDEYVFEEWKPKRADMAVQIRARNIVRLDEANFDSPETQAALGNLLKSLAKK